MMSSSVINMNDIWPLIPSDLKTAIRLARVNKNMSRLMINVIQARLSDPSYDDLLSVGIERYCAYDVKIDETKLGYYPAILNEHYNQYLKFIHGDFSHVCTLVTNSIYFRATGPTSITMIASHPINISPYSFVEILSPMHYRYFIDSWRYPGSYFRWFVYDYSIKLWVINNPQSSNVLRNCKLARDHDYQSTGLAGHQI